MATWALGVVFGGGAAHGIDLPALTLKSFQVPPMGGHLLPGSMPERHALQWGTLSIPSHRDSLQDQFPKPPNR
eukprot:2604659-Amphidinium_carterae.1